MFSYGAFVLLVFYLTNGADSKESPKILLAPRSQKVISGRQSMFRCEASGDPPPRIEWMENGERVTGARYSQDSYAGPGTSILWVWETLDRDCGHYECVADNGVGKPVVAVATLSVLSVEPEGYPRIFKNASTEETVPGQQVTLPCSSEFANKVSWVRDLKPLDMTDKRFSIDREGTLTVDKCTIHDGGYYRCVVESSEGLVVSTPSEILVTGPPTFSRTPLSQEHVKVNSDVKLSCSARGLPIPEVTWLRQDGSKLGAPTQRSQILKLANVRHSQTLTCVASNEHGRATFNTSVTVLTEKEFSKLKGSATTLSKDGLFTMLLILVTFVC